MLKLLLTTAAMIAATVQTMISPNNPEPVHRRSISRAGKNAAKHSRSLGCRKTSTTVNLRHLRQVSAQTLLSQLGEENA